MSLLVLIVLLLLVFGGLPTWGYHNYGYAPSGIGMYNGATLSTQSTICKLGSTFRCEDSEWRNLGTACQ